MVAGNNSFADDEFVEVIIADRGVVQGGVPGQKTVAVLVNAELLSHLLAQANSPAKLGKNIVYILIHLFLGETHHSKGMLLERDDLADIEAAGQVVHGYWQDSGNKDPRDATCSNTRLDGLVKGAQKGFSRGDIAVELVLAGGEQLVGKIIVLVHNNHDGRGTTSLDGAEDGIEIFGSRAGKVHRFSE